MRVFFHTIDASRLLALLICVVGVSPRHIADAESHGFGDIPSQYFAHSYPSPAGRGPDHVPDGPRSPVPGDADCRRAIRARRLLAGQDHRKVGGALSELLAVVRCRRQVAEGSAR